MPSPRDAGLRLRESTAPTRFPPTKGREMFRRRREPQSPRVEVRSRNILLRDRRPPSVPSVAAETYLSCRVCELHGPFSACSIYRRCWDDRCQEELSRALRQSLPRSSRATFRTPGTSPHPSARTPRSPELTSPHPDKVKARVRRAKPPSRKYPE